MRFHMGSIEQSSVRICQHASSNATSWYKLFIVGGFMLCKEWLCRFVALSNSEGKTDPAGSGDQLLHWNFHCGLHPNDGSKNELARVYSFPPFSKICSIRRDHHSRKEGKTASAGDLPSLPGLSHVTLPQCRWIVKLVPHGVTKDVLLILVVPSHVGHGSK